jgi:DNA-binding transcriptional LysR family regulator
MHAAVLHYLKGVARRGSKAADAFNLVSSAINRQTSKLEADLGVRLFDRMPDGMRSIPGRRGTAAACLRYAAAGESAAGASHRRRLCRVP